MAGIVRNSIIIVIIFYAVVVACCFAADLVSTIRRRHALKVLIHVDKAASPS